MKTDMHSKIKELEDKISSLEMQIFERKKTESENLSVQNELKLSEIRLRRAELASKSGNWELQLDTGEIYGSEGARKLYGLKGPIKDYSVIKELPLPEYRPILDKALNDLLQSGKPYNVEFRIKNAETGEILDIHSLAEFDKEKRTVFGVIQDITDRKKAEVEIKHKNLELAKFLEITLELLETVEKSFVLKKILESAISLIGLDTGAIYLKSGDEVFLEVTLPPLPDSFPPELRKGSIADHPRVEKAIKLNKTVIVNDIRELYLTHPEQVIVKSRNLVSVLYIPLKFQNQVSGVLIIGTSGRKHIFSEHEIDLSRTLSNIASLTLENSILLNNLTISRDKAQESDKLKTAFLHNISHEIRTPLNAIVGFSGFLNNTELSDSERRKYIDIIYQSNNQLLSIINDILNISQIETGQAILKESKFKPDLILETLHKQFQNEVEGKGLEFRLQNVNKVSDDNYILTDETKFIQILTNLLSNAVKFTNHGFIELSYGFDNKSWYFNVTDSGIGIPEEEQNKIFERFYQVNSLSTRSQGGTGLGLSISKAFAELMGGKLELKSEPGKGSKFTLFLPNTLVKVSTDNSYPISARCEVIKDSITILVAEDEDSNFMLIQAILKSVNYKIIRAFNGKEAVDLCIDNKIDFVLMDLKMPVIDGFTAISEIMKFNPDIRIIAQSAYAQPSDKEKAFKAGCIAYITKPFRKDQLLEVIESYLK